MRVGWLGAGHIATYHSKMLRAEGLDDVVWAGIYDRDPERAARFAAASGGTVARSEEEVLDDCDAVFICTWTSEHRRLVEMAVERGVAIFCEKPLATTTSDARAMADLVDGAGITNQVGLIMRRYPAFAVLRELAADPAAGRLMSFVFRDDQWLPVPGEYGSTWRGEADKAGAGVLLEHSIHDLDIIESALAPIRGVTARSSSFHGIPGIEDLMVVMLDLGDGATGSLTTVWHDVAPRPSLRRVEVFCERRWIALEGDVFGPVRWTDADGTTGELEGDALVARAAEAGVSGWPQRAFIEAARSKSPVSPNFRDAVRAHEVADAVYRSAAKAGAWMTV
jgi:predicted dehydrogenase